MKSTHLDTLDQSIYDLKMRFLVNLYILCSLVLVGFVIYLAVQQVIPVLILCSTALVIIGGIGILTAKRKVNLTVGANAFNLLTVTLIFATFFTSGGVQAPSLFWMPVICLSTLILLGKKQMFIVSGICFVGVFGFFMAQNLGFEFRSQYRPEMLFQVHYVHFVLLSFFVVSLGILQTKLQARTDEYKEQLHLRLNHENRLSSLGELTAGIGHELNNPLAIAMGNVECLKVIAEERNDKELDTATETMKSALTRMKNIIISVSRLSRAEDISREKFDVRKSIGETLSLFEEMFKKKDITINFDEGGGPLFVSGNIQQFTQVMTNLLSNSKDALLEAPKSRKAVTIEISEKAKVAVIDLKDNGAGIKPADMDKIFDSFFTTKVVGKGTGLGLSLSKRFINDMGGEITCKSTVGSGTCFTIELPLSAKED